MFNAVFAIFSGESIRREYATHTPKGSFLDGVVLVVIRACAILGCKHSIALLATTLYVLCAIAILVASLYLSGKSS